MFLSLQTTTLAFDLGVGAGPPFLTILMAVGFLVWVAFLGARLTFIFLFSYLGCCAICFDYFSASFSIALIDYII
jgi:hypothetical protein